MPIKVLSIKDDVPRTTVHWEAESVVVRLIPFSPKQIHSYPIGEEDDSEQRADSGS